MASTGHGTIPKQGWGVPPSPKAIFFVLKKRSCLGAETFTRPSLNTTASMVWFSLIPFPTLIGRNQFSFHFLVKAILFVRLLKPSQSVSHSPGAGWRADDCAFRLTVWEQEQMPCGVRATEANVGSGQIQPREISIFVEITGGIKKPQLLTLLQNS